MTDFLNATFEILKNFITGASGFFQWLITPLDALSVFGWELTPLAIFGFSTFIVVFTMVLIHLFNPVS